MVFISSTYTDLLAERQAAVSAILKSGNIPAGMELFSAGDKSQLVTIKRWIDQSDVYMLILGGRYGSIEPESGVSYTELEYDYAVSQGKPFFAVVISEDYLDAKVRLAGKDVLERENPKLLEQFRKKVLASVSSFFSDEKDIKLSIHESLGDIQLDDELAGWVQAREIPDVSILQEQLEKLSEENQELKKSLQKAEKAKIPSKDSEFEELVEMLRSTEVIVPAAVLGEDAVEDLKRDLLTLLSVAYEALMNGVTNSVGQSAHARFLYHNLAPKLAVFGLVENEKVTGVRYRRSYLTRKGSEFILYLKRTSQL
mmetsp:Transcript_14328/g.18446  ORF Transcript_14328/g.18446 Transcript_14328/m.18446 type:complete len:312 (-) Transcript_14328:133-1068(-)